MIFSLIAINVKDEAVFSSKFVVIICMKAMFMVNRIMSLLDACYNYLCLIRLCILDIISDLS